MQYNAFEVGPASYSTHLKQTRSQWQSVSGW
jgi:hypothetical protein